MRYVELAERLNGPIPRAADFTYVWGDALAELEHRRPDLWLINLETSITTSTDWEAKGINYLDEPVERRRDHRSSGGLLQPRQQPYTGLG